MQVYRLGICIDTYAKLEKEKHMAKDNMTKNEKIRKYLIWTRWKRALTARIISLLVTSLVGWLVTGNPLIGLSIGLVDMGIKIGVYYCHETVWERKMTKDIQKIKEQYVDENETKLLIHDQ